MKMIFALLFAACIAALPTAASAAQPTVEETIQTATAEKKLIFMQFGREACGNCQALRKLIASRQVILPKNNFVIADINCDDPTNSAAFRKLYQTAFADAKMLPFVVVADSDGTLLESTSGFKTAADYNKLVRSAKTKAKKN